MKLDRDRPHRLRDQSLNRLIPNMLTIIALCAGLTAVHFGLQGNWEKAIVAIVVGTSVLYDRHLHAELGTFDRDGDGMFAGDEANTEQERALSRVANDLSRTLAPITGGAFAVVYSALVFGGTATAIHMRRRSKMSNRADR